MLGTATSQTGDGPGGCRPATRRRPAGLACIQTALDGGTDPRQFARQVVEYLRGLLLVRMGNADQVDATTEMRQQMAATGGSASRLPRLLEAIRLFNAAASDTRSAWQPGLGLELALAEAVAERSRSSTRPARPRHARQRSPAGREPPRRKPPAANRRERSAQPGRTWSQRDLERAAAKPRGEEPAQPEAAAPQKAHAARGERRGTRDSSSARCRGRAAVTKLRRWPTSAAIGTRSSRRSSRPAG